MAHETFEGNNLDPNEILFMDPQTNEVYIVPFLDQEGTDGVHVSNIGTYPPKQVMGDWVRSNHEVVSTFVQSDFSGGGQIWDADEGADLNRFWFGTLSTQYPGQMTLPLQSLYHEDPVEANICIPLGDYGIDFYASMGLRLVTATNMAITDVATLAQVPVAKPAPVFQGTSGQDRLYIAMGSHGYQHWNGTALSPLITDVHPIQMLEWDDKLYALQSNGEVYESLNGVNDWILKVKVPSYTEPRGMIEFYNRSDDPTIYIICRRGVYAIDMSLGKAYKTKLDPPPHGDAGLSCTTWREDLYVSYGIGVHHYTGDSIIAMGLDRNDGVPSWLDGRICSMARGYGAMYCLVQGRQEATELLEPSFITDLGWHDYYMSPSSTRAALMAWNAFGWHAVWLPEENTRQPTALFNSAQTGRERLWWGVGNRLYWQDIHHMYYNPEQRQKEARYEESGWLETMVFDYSMDGQTKIFHAFEVMARHCTGTERIIIEYKRDSETWRSLATIDADTANNMHVIKAGFKGLFPDHVTKRWDGEPFIDIRFRIRMERGDDPEKTPVLESIGSVFHKLISPLRAFSVTVGVMPGNDSERLYKGRTIVELIAFIDRMVEADTLVPMLYGGQWRSVRFAGSSGTDDDGVLQTGVRSVSVLEVIV